jgi:hypothetical protein
MSSLTLNSNADSTNLAVAKLRDDGSNWADYSSRIQKAMGSKGLWRHVEGIAVTPKPYAVASGVPVTSDGKTLATEEQIEARETRISRATCHPFDNLNMSWREDKRPKNGSGDVGFSQE